MSKLEVLVATMSQTDFEKYSKMNVQTDAVFANQSDRHDYVEDTIGGNKIKMITTPYRGVGKNRNMALLYSTADYLLFADEDIVYVDNYEQEIIKAFNSLKKADVIIFSINLTKDGEVTETRQNNTRRLNVSNCFRHETSSVAVKRKSIEKANIWFSLLFGGGAIYGSGEDSLFFKECLNRKLRIYSHDFLIGNCAKDESTWFNGYNEKYYYDKGAWCASAFPFLKYLVALRFAFRLKKLSKFSYRKSIVLLFSGIKGFRDLRSFDEYKRLEK